MRISGASSMARFLVKSFTPVIKLIITKNIEMPKVTPNMATTVCLRLVNKCVRAISKVRLRFII